VVVGMGLWQKSRCAKHTISLYYKPTMNCPACNNQPLVPKTLSDGLNALTCPQCSGALILGEAYTMWRMAQNADLPEVKPEGLSLTVSDTDKARLCPACAHLMFPYTVGHATQVSLNRCATCGSFWLDANEWEVLEAHNLHDNLHQIASAEWAATIREEESKAQEEKLRQARFGEDYEEVRRIKDWLGTHPQRSVILAYLSSVAGDGK
jgi:Zn-finger nucleic acid-binding protein